MTTLEAAFRSGNGRRIKHDDQIVHSYLQLGVKEGDHLQVTRLSSSPLRAQALKIAVDKGNLRANGVLMSEAAIWSHTAPEVATLEVVGRRARSIDIWNSWSFDSVDSSWLGNAGILVDGDGPTYRLRCSDGLGDASFDDLVVDLLVRHA